MGEVLGNQVPASAAVRAGQEEKIKEMSFKEIVDFLECLDADADNIYCRFLCPNSSYKCDEFDDNNLPCKSINSLHELLNSEYNDTMQTGNKYVFIRKECEEYCKRFPFISQNAWVVFFTLLYRLIETDELLTIDQYVVVSQVVDNLAELFLDGHYNGDIGEPYWDMSLKQSDTLRKVFGDGSVRMYLPYENI